MDPGLLADLWRRERKEVVLKKILHVGVLTENFERAIAKFSDFGFRCTRITELKEVGVRIAFFPVGDSSIELLYYTVPDKEGTSVVRSQKGAINHICFEVEDLEASIRDFEKNGAKLVQGYPRATAHGRVAFFYPETTEGILIEICQA